ncbi:MAG: ornithine cyclodeaminase family protein [Steroidobacteraceae bacterium]
MQPIHLTYLNGPDIENLAPTDAEILDAVEQALDAQGRKAVVLEPRVHLVPQDSSIGHFNVLRAVVHPLGLAGVKVVGDFVNNYTLGLPSEIGLLALFDPATGQPKAILNATAITDMRTGALTALGAKYLARKESKVLGHIGARGTSYWNIRLLDHYFDFDEIRVHSQRLESRRAFAERLSKELNKTVRAVDSWEACVRNADIVVEASRLVEPAPLLKTAWIKRGALIVPYGTMSAVELSLTDIMDKVVVDDWQQCRKGLPYGALRRHVDLDKLTEQSLYAELGQIVAKLKPGRENDQETILFWHRGLATSDIALGAALLKKAASLRLGQQLTFS